MSFGTDKNTVKNLTLLKVFSKICPEHDERKKLVFQEKKHLIFRMKFTRYQSTFIGLELTFPEFRHSMQLKLLTRCTKIEAQKRCIIFGHVSKIIASFHLRKNDNISSKGKKSFCEVNAISNVNDFFSCG